MVRITACKNFSCHISESGIDKTVRLTKETNNIVIAHAILVDTLKYKEIKFCGYLLLKISNKNKK